MQYNQKKNLQQLQHVLQHHTYEAASLMIHIYPLEEFVQIFYMIPTNLKKTNILYGILYQLHNNNKILYFKNRLTFVRVG
jgi:hypothetical protein